MNIENAKIAIDKMSAFLPDYILNDLYKDHNATAHSITKDDSKVVFSVVFNEGEKRILTVTVKRNVNSDDVRLHRHEISVHYNGNMQVFSKLINAEFYIDIINVLFPVINGEPDEDEKTDGKNYYSFRKNEGDKWVKISDKVASYILDQNDIAINGLCDSVASYCQYDCYYNVNLKSE